MLRISMVKSINLLTKVCSKLSLIRNDESDKKFILFFNTSDFEIDTSIYYSNFILHKFNLIKIITIIIIILEKI